ncbi:MAG: DciA family protein [Rhodospirillaceae bacterium]|nr:DciA family protein [Rhodospirillaceae bacterium]
MSPRTKRKAYENGTPDRTSRGLLGIAALTERVARPVLGKRGFSAGQVIGRWTELVGAELAASTSPERVQFHRGARVNGTLYLRVASGAAAALVQPQVPLIIERLNGFLGPNAISDIKVTQGPLPHRYTKTPVPRTRAISSEALADAETEVGALGSDALRNSLARLGARLRERG